MNVKRNKKNDPAARHQRVMLDRTTPAVSSPIRVDWSRSVTSSQASPTRLGRYIVLEFLGSGRVADSYRAYDPDMRREVVLKRPRQGVLEPGAAEGFVRGARAMARVVHPNVAKVYEIAEDESFVTMEMVQGTPLPQWLTQTARSRADVLRVFVQAGRGIEVAHRHGIVHPYFPASSVCVGSDGVTRVMDFGSASERRGALLSDQVHARMLGVGHLGVGFAAPEVSRGEASTKLSEQFSFCVSLFVALNGAGPSLDPGSARAEAVADAPTYRLAAQPVLRTGSGGPEDSLLRRGFSGEPEHRWPSMTVLLDALEASPPKKFWLRRVLGGAGALVAGVSALLLLSAPANPCTEALPSLSGVWDVARREEVSVAFASVEQSFASDSWTAVENRMDRFALDWENAQIRLCEATGVDAVDPRVQEQHACLARRRDEAAALVDQLAAADVNIVRRAVEAVALLPRASDCETPNAEYSRAGLSPQMVTEIQAVERDVARVSALKATGQWDLALDAAMQNLERAEQTGHRPLLIRANLDVADSSMRAGEPEAARVAYRSALREAVGSGDVEPQAEALVGLAYLSGMYFDDIGAMLWMCRDAEALLQGLESPSPLMSRVHLVRAEAQLIARGVPRTTEDSTSTAGTFPGYDPLRTAAMGSLSALLLEQGKYDQAARVATWGLRVVESHLGASHPLRAKFLVALGESRLHQGKSELARAAFAEGDALSREAGGA